MTDEEKKAIKIVKNWIKYERCEDTEPVIHETILNLIEKQENKIKQQAELIRKQHSIITSCEMEHDYDVKMIDEVKGRAVKYYKIIENMAKELTNLLEATEEEIIERFTKEG